MLKTPKDFVYDKLADSLSRQDYRLAANDALSYRVFTNDGFKLIDLATSASNAIFFPVVETLIESDGMAKLPLVGRVKLAGLTVIEAEKLLEEKYAEFYVKPYVNIRVQNKRVIVFPGNAGSAKVISVGNNNTSVIEVIAQSGGITEDGKAYKVKLIRNTPNKKPEVYLMDLSRIEGLKAANTQVQANDIIYVEPRYRPARTFAAEIAPLITLVSSFAILTSLLLLSR